MDITVFTSAITATASSRGGYGGIVTTPYKKWVMGFNGYTNAGSERLEGDVTSIYVGLALLKSITGPVRGRVGTDSQAALDAINLGNGVAGKKLTDTVNLIRGMMAESNVELVFVPDDSNIAAKRMAELGKVGPHCHFTMGNYPVELRPLVD